MDDRKGYAEMALSDLTPADRHRRIAGTFADRAAAATAWDAPAPVPGWTARDVVRHLVEWFPGFLAGGTGITIPPGPSVDQDPAAAWAHQSAAIQALLDDPATDGRVLTNPHLGDVPLDQAVDRFYTTDVFMHTWDLARATGQDDTLEADFCARILAGMETMEEVIRGSGQYGPKVPTPDDAGPQTRMLGFIGRDPRWTPARVAPIDRPGIMEA